MENGRWIVQLGQEQCIRYLTNTRFEEPVQGSPAATLQEYRLQKGPPNKEKHHPTVWSRALCLPLIPSEELLDGPKDKLVY